MVENVFILGAGASKEAGAPLMSEFIDVAEDLSRAGEFGDETAQIDKVFEVIALLQQVYSKSFLDLTNIESLFGALEMATIIDQLGKIPKNNILQYRDSLVKLIVRTIEKSMSFTSTSDGLKSHPSYEYFVKILIAKRTGSSSIITFNYDMGLDVAIHQANKYVNYGLNPGDENGIKLLKLHGSINWARSKPFANNPSKILPYTLDLLKRDFPGFPFGPKVHFSNYLKVLNNEIQNIEIHDSPVIVPPTWNKTEYHGSITNVWSAAANDLNSARNIYIFGYSLPETDSFFRYLYALGTMGDTRIRRFWVFDPDTTGLIKGRYEKLLGAGHFDGGGFTLQYLPKTAGKHGVHV